MLFIVTFNLNPCLVYIINIRDITLFFALHFWIGSYRGISDGGSKPAFPRGVIAGTDIIGLIEDMGNHIPDKSWMLYLLELFNNQSIAIELNLICQFDNQNYFEAIFNGVNRYQSITHT